ncbi:MAG: reverse transcriptase domain-containing protein, partial [Cetobacterium sp.]
MSLIEKIVCSENIKMAIDNIRKNKGSQTPGTDGKTIEYIIANKEVIIDKIKRELTTNNYRTNTIKRVEIPKGDGKMRPLGVPTIYDRIVQQSFKQILESIIDKKFHPNSFGFRPKRSTENALALSSNLINRGKMYFVVDIDIKGFFDNINHNKLIKQLYKMGIKDRKIISLIKVML